MEEKKITNCLDCDKFNDLADENQAILKDHNNLKEDYTRLQIKYDRYDLFRM